MCYTFCDCHFCWSWGIKLNLTIEILNFICILRVLIKHLNNLFVNIWVFLDIGWIKRIIIKELITIFLKKNIIWFELIIINNFELKINIVNYF